MAKDTLKNNTILDINSTIGDVTIKIVDPGFSTEHRVFSFSGRVKKNTQVNVGTLRVDAETNKFFVNSPGLISKSSNRKNNLKSELNLSLTSIEKNAKKKPIAYNYNMLYTSRDDISGTKGLNYILSNKVKGETTRTTGIDRVIFGKKEIDINGGRRQIKVYGKAGSTFKLAVNEFVDRTPTTLDDDGNWIIESFEEQSILSALSYNSTFSNHLGLLNIIDGKIDSSGVHAFNQKFPSKSVESRYSINILPTTVSNSFNKNIWNTLRPGWNTWYSKILYQYINPSLTLRVTCTNGKFTSVNGTSINSSTPYDKVYNGVANRTASSLENKKPVVTAAGGSYLQVFDLEYIVIASHAMAEVAAHPVVFDPYTLLEDPTTSETEYSSSWTNSNPNSNGGTMVNMSVISNVLTDVPGTNRTYTLKLKVNIEKWGTKSIIMAFHLDDHLTLA
tara:strand:- start:4185 stop:5525 length:1341 start_codon:yes stop_codon:yes gene_type:complete